MRIVVTGGSGKAGRAVVRELLEHGHRVRNVDLVPDRDPVCGFRRADLTDLGQQLRPVESRRDVLGYRPQHSWRDH